MSKKHYGKQTGRPVTQELPTPAGGVRLETFIPWRLVRRGSKKQIITPLDAPEEFRVEAGVERRERAAAQHTPLIRALGLAHYWQRLLDEGKYRTITEIAAIEGIDRGQASKIARLAQLAPEIVEACMEGGLALDPLIRRAYASDWGEQRARLLIGRA
jgi:hypothetical protein